MEMCGQLHASAALPKVKNCQYPWNKRGWVKTLNVPENGNIIPRIYHRHRPVSVLNALKIQALIA